jgi:DMSO/TMAO reductase YedYZ molybdopterin-dependent catalytic subunit
LETQQVFRPEDAEVVFPVGRRVFLGIVGLTGAAVLWGAKAQGFVERFAPAGENGIFSLLPVGRFRIYSVTGTLPKKEPQDYRLSIDGLVDRPVRFTFDELRAMTPTSITRDFQCVTGWRVPDVKWRGVSLAALLDAAGVQAAATAVTFTSFDGVYTESLTLEQARRDDVIVAYEMEGQTVTQPHGGPVRLYVAPMYGYKSLKWLSDIILVDKVEPGYWERLGYDVDAWVGQSNGRDDRPT